MKGSHLTDENLALAALNPEDLTREQKDHLRSCLECRTEKEKLSQALTGLEEKAVSFQPQPSGSFRSPLPSTSAHRRTGFRRFLPGGFSAGNGREMVRDSRLGLVLAGALTLAAVVLLTTLTGPPEVKTVPPQANLTEPVVETDNIISDSEVLQQDVFSSFQQFVIGQDHSGLNESFIDFVAPFSYEDRSSQLKGGDKC